ncbi:phage tail protein [Kitasatospora sp. NPDC002040]|uniref:phage distal tail protein n=1 Tax=Kitasatospora sp. NPDC002040 TaxID=3154661 RepID=UPI0033312E9C
MPTPGAVLKSSAPGSLITCDGQVQWAGLLMGPGTPYQITAEGFTGWEDLPGLSSSDVPRPTAHGAWPGARWAQPRIVTVTVWVLPPSGGAPADALAALLAATAPTADGDDERWLTVRLHDESLACQARVTQRTVQVDRSYARLGATRVALQWVATDPRRFEPELLTEVGGLPEPERGLGWDLAWGQRDPANPAWESLDWGVLPGSGDLVVRNEGSAPAQPVIEIVGPCVKPRLTVAATGAQLGYNISLKYGRRLVIDTAAGTVLLDGEEDVRATALSGSLPENLFALQPGTTVLRFRADWGTGDAKVLVRRRNAHW